MGYSIMTPFESREAREKMLDFMKRNYRTANELLRVDFYNHTRGPTDNLSYGSRKEKFTLGFDFSGGGFERAYIHRLCAWMAMMNGKKKKFEGKKLPFIIYDGIEDIVLAREKISFKGDIEQEVVDENGFYLLFEDEIFADELAPEKSIKIIKDELARLTASYESEQEENKK